MAVGDRGEVANDKQPLVAARGIVLNRCEKRGACMKHKNLHLEC